MKLNVKCSKHLTIQDPPHTNMIVTSINCKINIYDDNFYCYIDEKIMDMLRSNGFLRRKYVVYKIHINNLEKHLMCPMLNLHNGKNVVLWPSLKLPLRSYPVHVYLFAAAKYLTGNINMRTAAERTRKKFGLATFSHSTLSRFLRKFSRNILLFLSVFRTFCIPSTSDPPLVKRKRWSDIQSGDYENLLSVIRPVLTEGNELRFGADLNYGFYNITHKFVI